MWRSGLDVGSISVNRSPEVGLEESAATHCVSMRITCPRFTAADVEGVLQGVEIRRVGCAHRNSEAAQLQDCVVSRLQDGGHGPPYYGFRA
ncbi:MAG: hypothetical protein GXP29_10125 [Planctomycetes bacterium]|nr:hypothetical protein [Planctomycetota bacterium]